MVKSALLRRQDCNGLAAGAGVSVQNKVNLLGDRGNTGNAEAPTVGQFMSTLLQAVAAGSPPVTVGRRAGGLDGFLAGNGC